MVKPELGDGMTRIANEILEALSKTNLSSYQSRLLFAIIRKTYGFGKKNDWIAISQLVEITGIKKSHVSRAKAQLIERKIVTSIGNKIGFNKYYSQWVELPKQATVTNLGQELPIQGHTKETIQKKIYIYAHAHEFLKTINVEDTVNDVLLAETYPSLTDEFLKRTFVEVVAWLEKKKKPRAISTSRILNWLKTTPPTPPPRKLKYLN